MGIELAILGVVAAVGGFAAAGGFSGPEDPGTPAALPDVPDPGKAEAAAQADEIKKRKKRIAKANTILTSGQGAEGEAPVGRKTLLGE